MGFGTLYVLLNLNTKYRAKGKTNISIASIIFHLLLVYLFTVPSSIQPIRKKTITEEGENVSVSCNASGTSPLMVSWIKVESGEHFDGSELVFTYINRSQAGQYKCEASNECGNASETATIEVQCKYQFLVYVLN